jgi:hypothetical protein
MTRRRSLPIKMEDGEAPVLAPGFRHLGSMLSKNFDGSATMILFFFFLEISFITHSMQRRPALARRPPQGP